MSKKDPPSQVWRQPPIRVDLGPLNADREKCPLCGSLIKSSQVQKVECTRRQLDMLQTIASHIHSLRRGPSLAELGNSLGVTKNAIVSHLDALQNKGLLRREKGKRYSIEITERGYDVLRKVAVGQYDALDPDKQPLKTHTKVDRWKFYE